MISTKELFELIEKNAVTEIEFSERSKSGQLTVMLEGNKTCNLETERKNAVEEGTLIDEPLEKLKNKLLKNSSLKKVTLKNLESAPLMKTLLEGLRVTGMVELSLMECDWTSSNVRYLSDILSNSTSLKRFNFLCYGAGTTEWRWLRTSTIKALTNLLSKHTDLQHIALCGRCVIDDTVTFFFDWLKELKQLKSLDLSNNHFIDFASDLEKLPKHISEYHFSVRYQNEADILERIMLKSEHIKKLIITEYQDCNFYPYSWDVKKLASSLKKLNLVDLRIHGTRYDTVSDYHQRLTLAVLKKKGMPGALSKKILSFLVDDKESNLRAYDTYMHNNALIKFMPVKSADMETKLKKQAEEQRKQEPILLKKRQQEQQLLQMQEDTDEEEDLSFEEMCELIRKNQVTEITTRISLKMFLVELNKRDCRIDSKQLKELKKIISSNTSLRKVKIDMRATRMASEMLNGLCVKGMKSLVLFNFETSSEDLSDILLSAPSLTTFKYAYEVSVQPPAPEVFDLISTNSANTLQKITLRNILDERNIKSVIDLIGSCKRLTSLDLSYNDPNFYKDCLKATTSTAVTELCLSIRNVYRDDGGTTHADADLVDSKLISEALQENKNIKKLILYKEGKEFGFFDIGCFGMLLENKHISSLIFVCAKPDQKSLKQFLECVPRNNTLTELYINSRRVLTNTDRQQRLTVAILQKKKVASDTIKMILDFLVGNKEVNKLAYESVNSLLKFSGETTKSPKIQTELKKRAEEQRKQKPTALKKQREEEKAVKRLQS